MSARQWDSAVVESSAATVELLTHGRIIELGRVLDASNDTRLVIVESGGDSIRAICKPIAGSRPLHDFDARTLSMREVAAYRLSQALGLNLVPPTVLRTDVSLPGSLQAYVEPADTPTVEVFDADDVPQGWIEVFSGTGADDEPVVLAHAFSEELRRLALFDILTNNADRKGGHIITGHYLFNGTDPQVFGIDNGLTFHLEPKLRTVLWGFAHEPFAAAEIRHLEQAGDLDTTVLSELLAPAEIEAVRLRAHALLRLGEFPSPPADRYPIPWPPL